MASAATHPVEASDLTVGVLGMGRIGQVHAHNLSRRGVNLLVADLMPERAESWGQDVPNATAVNPADLFEQGRLNVLVLAVPTALHELYIRQAMEAHLHTLFCEKPLTGDLASAQKLVRDLARTDMRVQIGFQRRCDPASLAVAERFASGELGELTGVVVKACDATPPPEEYVAASDGIFADMLIHSFEEVARLTGRAVTTVQARGVNRGGLGYFATHGDVDTAVILLILEGGVPVTMFGTRQHGAGYDHSLQLCGTLDTAAVPAGNYPGFLERYAAAYRAEMDALLDYALGNRSESPCPPRSALRAQAVAEACHISFLRAGAGVAVAEILEGVRA